MPKLTVEGFGTVDVEPGKRLVLAIEQDAKVDILHACGGNARVPPCRVEFIDGEPARHTAAEVERLTARDLTGVRLSCQILCDHDMTVRAISRLPGSGRPAPAGAPAAPTPAVRRPRRSPRRQFGSRNFRISRLQSHDVGFERRAGAPQSRR